MFFDSIILKKKYSGLINLDYSIFVLIKKKLSIEEFKMVKSQSVLWSEHPYSWNFGTKALVTIRQIIHSAWIYTRERYGIERISFEIKNE